MRLWQVFACNFRLVPVALIKLFDYSYEEPRRVLMVGHHSYARRKLVQNILWVKVVEHGLLNLAVKISWHVWELVILRKPWVASFFFCFRIQEFPLSQTILVFKARNAGFNQSNFSSKLFQGSSNYSFIFDWIKRASAVRDLSTDF